MTVHEDLAEGIWDDIREDPEEAAAVFRVQKMHTGGDLDDEGLGSAYANSLGSSARFQPSRWPVHQTAAFAYLHALVGGGQVAYVPISTGGTPGPDADRIGNAELLRKTCRPFHAELDMTQNGADFDGTLEWAEKIRLERGMGSYYYENACQNTKQSRLTYLATTGASWAPLEVGDSWPSRTLMHLAQFGAVARWPYGSKFILLFVNFGWGPQGEVRSSWEDNSTADLT
ncbi:hypothetical protein [Streptomyces sp. AS02]|uniref:hypothetical protein n=1 Tax=Streptomyces sp. AS02 TaxID=2938946 RepID=UPI0020202E2D|nr:hypothetical protein [Streptomyces sp. AS02]MCL8016954.1 hypothetical protein [Streptomyces sp. AS02]